MARAVAAAAQTPVDAWGSGSPDGALRPKPHADAGESVLGRGTRVRGRVHGDGALRVEGAIEGGVQVSGDLEIDDGGSVAGDVEAGAVTIGGQLTGNASARGPITIRASARVTGDMLGAEVILEEGAVFTGRIEAEFDMPAELTGRPGGR